MMTPQEARFLLEAYRPNGQDTADAKMAEALRVLLQDPELTAWFKESLAFDKEVADRLQHLPIPPEIKSQILAGRHLIPQKSWWQKKTWWAVAAILITALILSIRIIPNSTTQPNLLTEYRGDMADFLTDQLSGFDHYTSDLNEVKSYLVSRGTLNTLDLPKTLQSLESIGCKVLDWNGHKVSLICLLANNADPIHLLIIGRQALSDWPKQQDLVTVGNWMMASWSNEQHNFLLASKSEQSLRSILL